MAAQPMTKIFSYLPNPMIAFGKRRLRLLISTLLPGCLLEIIGDRPGELTDWLWDVIQDRLPTEKG